MPRRLDMDTALALVKASRLFDDEWYALQVGTSFVDRESAARHWIEHAATTVPHGISPHPLFAPLWLWPGARWVRSAPDPLSFWLANPEEQRRQPHPQVDLEATGPLEDWLVGHAPDELLASAAPRSAEGDVGVVIEASSLREAVAWIRHFRRRPSNAAVHVVADTGWTPVLAAVAADVPEVRVAADAVPQHRIVVTVGPRVRPPRWSWLLELLAALERPGTATAQPVLLTPEFTVAAAGAAFTADGARPLLSGLTADDAARLAGLPLPAPWPGVLARRTDVAEGDHVLAPASRVVVTDLPEFGDGPVPAGAKDRTRAAWRAAGFESSGMPLRVRDGRPALRWSINISAGATQARWGDLYFARSLAAALERLGQWVVIDHPETWHRATRELDDVTLTLRGLHGMVPEPGQTSLLWVISHPELVTAEECTAYDAVFAASTSWAAGRTREWGLRVDPLPQCTDAGRFHPGLAPPDTGPPNLFVGNSRGQLRPAVEAAIETGLPLDVWGGGWHSWLPTPTVRLAGEHVDNADLGALYTGAGLVLNDHWDDMRTEGFVSNRVFDVLACGARLLSDDVTGLREALGEEIAEGVRTFRDTADFARLTAAPVADRFPTLQVRESIAEQVLAEHTFDARARTLLATARALRTAS